MRGTKGVDLDGQGGKEEVRGAEGKKILISIYPVKQKTTFSKGKKVISELGSLENSSNGYTLTHRHWNWRV